jgi:hypothetical protein
MNPTPALGEPTPVPDSHKGPTLRLSPSRYFNVRFRHLQHNPRRQKEGATHRKVAERC